MNYKFTRNWENAEKIIFNGVGKYNIPQIQPEKYIPCEWVSFNYAKTTKDGQGKGVHHFVDDYQFIREWTNIDTYVKMFEKFDCVMSPDFSTYADFPMALQIYNHYRKHWIGAYLQAHGIKVIPTISWSTPESFEWCFDGEPTGSVVAVSSVGCNKCMNEFILGYKEMVDRLRPTLILFYGYIPKECTENIIRIKPFQDKWKECKTNGW